MAIIDSEIHNSSSSKSERAVMSEQAGYRMGDSKQNFSIEEVSNVLGRHEGFDRESFFNLYEDTGEETVMRIMAHFNQNLIEASRNIKAALVNEHGNESENVENIWKWAHKIAGSAALLGFKSYGDESRELSKKIRDQQSFADCKKQVEDYLKKTKALSQNIEEAMPSLKTYL
ncbi:hypothetical protein A11Q_1436 [Pseudobdellovibrio exovorus JSS]|uniref:HPt domain-containing protein n=2 Tax=Pseudobdellovibrio exovorus TaxID=453816 RepID=M4V8D4_9BACT|nr:hypothetical protein A11Q_1436 [Pseudobdellovibrio exovorus JSS]